MNGFDWQRALAHPLTMIGAGMMAGSDPRGTGFGGIGQGLMYAGETMRSQEQLAEENERARMLADLQMQEYQAKLSGMEARRQREAEYLGSLPEAQRPLAAVDPGMFARQQAESMFATPQRSTQMKLYMDAGGEAGTGKTFNEWLATDYQNIKSAGTQVSVKLPAEITEEQKVVGKYYGQQFTQLMDAERQARAQNAKLERLDQLFDEAYTGIGGKEVQSAKRALGILGLDTEGVGEAEAAQALSAEMALQLRNPAGGAGMPGAMSDRDREFLQSMIPSLATTAEGRKLMVATKKKLNQRSIDVAKMAREYRRKFGRLDENFYDQLAAYSDANPMFEEERPKVVEAVQPEATGFKIIGVRR